MVETPRAGPPSICVHIEADIDLTVSDVWPDGDAPEVITAEAVRDVMQGAGPRARVIADWGLAYGVGVTVGDGTEVEVWPEG